MKFLLDNQLPISLGRWIAAQGIEVKHVQRLGWDEKSDLYIWQFAIREQWIVITKDEDFINLANRKGDAGSVLWLRLGNIRTRKMIEIFESQWPRIIRSFENGSRVVELSYSDFGP